MVDYASYFQYGPGLNDVQNGSLWINVTTTNCSCADCQENEGLTRRYRTAFDSVGNQNRKVWEDEQYMLCPPRVLGYIFREKQWAQLQVDLLHDIPLETNDSAWSSRLQLSDDKIKPLLHGLVRSHVSNSKKSSTSPLQVDDIVPQKGKGLVILLYGTSQQMVFSIEIYLESPDTNSLGKDLPGWAKRRRPR